MADQKKITKTVHIEQIAEKTGLSKKQASEAYAAFVETLTDNLRQGVAVGVQGLGTFEVRATSERQGVKPGSSERITIPAGKKVAFKVGTDLKSTIK